MSKDKVEDFKSSEEEVENLEQNEVQDNQENEVASEEISSEAEEEKDEVEVLQEEITSLKDKHLRLYSEFENYRRRTARERSDLIKTATEDLMVELVSVLDDFERAKGSISEEQTKESLEEGFELIYQKLTKILKNKGLEPMKDKQGSEFDADVHEAISQIPAPDKKLKGKIVDIIERGYKLNEKVIRFAKVVIGS